MIPPPYRRCSTHAIKTGTESANRLVVTQIKNHHNSLQNQESMSSMTDSRTYLTHIQKETPPSSWAISVPRLEETILTVKK